MPPTVEGHFFSPVGADLLLFILQPADLIPAACLLAQSDEVLGHEEEEADTQHEETGVEHALQVVQGQGADGVLGESAQIWSPLCLRLSGSPHQFLNLYGLHLLSHVLLHPDPSPVLPQVHQPAFHCLPDGPVKTLSESFYHYSFITTNSFVATHAGLHGLKE